MAKILEKDFMKATELRERAKRFIERGNKFPEGSKERTNYHVSARNDILVAMSYELNCRIGAGLQYG